MSLEVIKFYLWKLQVGYKGEKKIAAHLILTGLDRVLKKVRAGNEKVTVRMCRRGRGGR